MNLEDVRRKLSQKKFVVYRHARVEWVKDGLTDDEVKAAILGGRVVENYFPKRPRVLIVGRTAGGLPLHVILELNQRDTFFIVTAYVPCKTKWLSEAKRKP